MHDEVYMRQWNDHHQVISHGIDRLLARLHIGHREADKAIEPAYANPAKPDAERPATHTALLSGLAAVIITAVIFTGGIATVTEARPMLAGPVENGSYLVELA